MSPGVMDESDAGFQLWAALDVQAEEHQRRYDTDTLPFIATAADVCREGFSERRDEVEFKGTDDQ